MKVSQMIQSKFLKKEDLEDGDKIVTIKGIELESMQGNESEQRYVLYFRELPKGMVLNVTTIRVLENAFGDDSDDWMGKQVKMYVDPNVSFQGKVVGGLRLMPPRKGAKPAAKAAVEAATNDFDDEIPF
jgi:hypothetical protein